MGMTITEKILAAHAGLESISPGDLIEATVDRALANDITAPLAIDTFGEIGAQEVFDREKVILVADHFVPNKDIASAEQVKKMRDFARRQELRHYYESGDAGIEHVILPERGLVGPGQLIVGADSHTCTYGALGAFSTGVGSTDLGAVLATGTIWLKVPPTIRIEYEGFAQPYVGGKDLILYTIGMIGVEGAIYSALEFGGSAVGRLAMHHRFTMANMAVEAGAKNGIFTPDDITIKYIRETSGPTAGIYASDPDAKYAGVVTISLGELEPQVAFPHSPANVRPVSMVGDVSLDQVFIGSCTNGWYEDLVEAASVLKGRKAARGIRLIVIPGSPAIYRRALRDGIIETFIDAGAVIGPPCCGPCLGGHLGILASGERAVSTSNRNFIGRMGHPQSEVYLSNPAVAAASAVLGKIGDPREM